MSLHSQLLRHLPIHYAYGAIALFISLLNNIFLLFYVDTFVNVYKIDQTSFWIGEAIFLIWNSINDPLFGWLSDRKSLASTSPGNGSLNSSTVLRRIRALARYGPLFAISFLFFWFPLLPASLQFVACLCLYDAFLTMVDLHHQALLADLAIKSADRAKLNSYCSIFSACGSVSVFLSYMVWDKHNLVNFRIFCTACSLFVAVGFIFCTMALEKHFGGRGQDQQLKEVQNEDSGFSDSTLSAQQYAAQLMRHRNFLWFALMNVIQVFHCHFNSNFFPLFIEHLLGHVITPGMGAALLGFSFFIPHINNLYFLSLCRRFGAYSVIRGLFVVKLVLAAAMWSFGLNWKVLLCLFIASFITRYQSMWTYKIVFDSNRVFTEGTCKLLNLVISDLVDEDFVINGRKEAVSALVFGMSALLSKPGQTIAPLLGTWLLYKQTGRSVFFEKGSRVVLFGEEASLFFKHGCFSVLVLVPIACAILQLIVWSRFQLKGSRLSYIKSSRAGLESRTKLNV